MSAQMVLGSEVASMQAVALRRLHGRGLRAPSRLAFPGLSPAQRLALTTILVPADVDQKSLANCSAALAAVRNYYRAIGSDWDAERFDDMLTAVELRLGCILPTATKMYWGSLADLLETLAGGAR